jgi:hypothetical protein
MLKEPVWIGKQSEQIIDQAGYLFGVEDLAKETTNSDLTGLFYVLFEIKEEQRRVALNQGSYTLCYSR